MYIYKLLKSKLMKPNYLKSVFGIVFLLLLISCKIEPQAINYGSDQCHYCSMNIVDKAHAAQYVTNKGKQFKFDSIECMMHDLRNKKEAETPIVLVADFSKPGTMIKAEGASYIISSAIKSPMGANLSALESKEKANEIKQQYSGELFNWESLKIKLAN